MNIREFYKAKAIGFVAVVLIVVAGAWVYQHTVRQPVAAEVETSSHKDAVFMIGGTPVQLVDGNAAEENDTGVVTRYFGNELVTDLDGDGAKDDVAFIVTQETGGSGTFYYAVGAVSTEEGFKGSDGYLLGDRIAPAATVESPNPRHKNVVVFNYATRAPGEAMTERPSVGVSAYLKLVPDSMQWAIVVPDFEGESR